MAMTISEKHPVGAVVRQGVAGAVAGRVRVGGKATSTRDVSREVMLPRRSSAQAATRRSVGSQHDNQSITDRCTRSMNAGRAAGVPENRRRKPGAAVNLSAAGDSPQVKPNQAPGEPARQGFALARHNTRRNDGILVVPPDGCMQEVDGNEHPIAPARKIDDNSRRRAGPAPVRVA